MAGVRAIVRVLVAVVVLLAACDRTTSGRLRIAYVTNGVDPFWTLAETGAHQAGKDLDVDVLVEMPAEGITHQKQILEDLLTKGVDGVAVSPIDHQNQTPLLDRIAATMPLVTHDSDAPLSKRRAFVGMDNYDAGRMVGRMVREAVPAGGKIMLFIGRLEQDNARARVLGTLDAILDRPRDPARNVDPDRQLTAGAYTVLGVRTDQFDKSVAKANAADALTAHPDLACMVGLFAYNPPAILEALGQANRRGKVSVVGFDEQDATLQGIVDGEVFGTVVQDPYQYGYRSVAVLKALLQGDPAAVPASGEIHIPARRITAAEVEAFWADKRAKLRGDGK